MCPENEHMTPPAILVYLKSGKRIRKTKDNNSHRHKNWLIRDIPNLFPAFNPPEKETRKKPSLTQGSFADAVGHHEVLVESPRHDGHPANTPIPQLLHVINAYIERLKELSSKPYVRYVSIFRNHGLEAGASLSHAHSQIIATPIIPTIIQKEIEASKELWKQNKKCPFCKIIKKERNGPRLILENQHFLAFAPYASINPMEFWITPRKHETTLLDMQQNEAKALAETLKKCLKALKQLANDPPYNYGFHIASDAKTRNYYHWHLEVYPRLAIWAGFEKSTGMYINTVTPEAAAEELRKTISS